MKYIKHPLTIIKGCIFMQLKGTTSISWVTPIEVEPWSFKDFENMLKNRKYIWEWYFNCELENKHGNEPIIDVDTFNKAQEILTINKRQTGGKSRQKREYACSGRIYCKRCGAPMITIDD